MNEPTTVWTEQVLADLETGYGPPLPPALRPATPDQLAAALERARKAEAAVLLLRDLVHATEARNRRLELRTAQLRYGRRWWQRAVRWWQDGRRKKESAAC